jgi:hypothetical protein
LGGVKAVDEFDFGAIAGLVVLEVSLAERIEVSLILTGEDDDFGVQPMLAGIEADARLTFFGAGSGGVLGIFAIDGGAILHGKFGRGRSGERGSGCGHGITLSIVS